MLLREVMGDSRPEWGGAGRCPRDWWGLEPTPSLSGLPCQTGAFSPQSIQSSQHWLGQCRWKAYQRSVLPLVPGTRVSTWQRPLALSVLCFYIYIYISIILLKKGKIILILSLGKAMAMGVGRVSGKGLASWHSMAHSSWTFLIACQVRPSWSMGLWLVSAKVSNPRSVSYWTAGCAGTG